jgi:hypothetical protein
MVQSIEYESVNILVHTITLLKTNVKQVSRQMWPTCAVQFKTLSRLSGNLIPSLISI